MKYKTGNITHTFSMSNISKNHIKEGFYMVLGSLLMAFATAQFLLPNHLSTGGFSGIATIIYYFWGIPMGTTTILLNLPLFIIAYLKLGGRFLVKSIIGTSLLSLFLNLLEIFAPLTEDKLLACIYGGIIMGLGTAFILKGSASTGGSDLITTLVKKYKPEIRSSNFIMVFDTVIVALNVLFFKTIEIGLYSAIAIYLMGKIIDIFFEGINFSKMMYIVSDKYEDISDEIQMQIERGTTGIYGKGMYTGEEKTILLCVASRSEVIAIRKIVEQVDANAFIVIANAREVFGKGFKEEEKLL